MKLCQLYKDHGCYIKSLLRVLITEFDVSLEAKDNNEINVRKFLNDNDLFTDDDAYELLRRKKRRV